MGKSRESETVMQQPYLLLKAKNKEKKGLIMAKTTIYM